MLVFDKQKIQLSLRSLKLIMKFAFEKFIAVGFRRRNNEYKTNGFSPNTPATGVAKA
jgi:hypothetical protein